MIWTIILRFAIQDISVEGGTEITFEILSTFSWKDFWLQLLLIQVLTCSNLIIIIKHVYHHIPGEPKSSFLL